MNQLALHPNVYATGEDKGLVPMLERVWVREHAPGDGEFYLISGFANYNGGVRFFDVFRRHVAAGGRVEAFLGGSTRQNLSSKQVVRQLLEVGAEVSVINRKRLMHAKSYGTRTATGESVIVTSGNFTGPGMSQNVEMAVLLDQPSTRALGFSWHDLKRGFLEQRWDIHRPSLADLNSPAWQLLYDEEAGAIVLDETEELTMILRLSHADTARIQAQQGSRAGLGSQYFWLPKDSYGFFPPLTIRNERGVKSTFATQIRLRYVDLGLENDERVTFEAENNLDFRLGTGRLRYTRLAAEGDLAAISRVGEHLYELRMFQSGTEAHRRFSPYAINFIGHQGKMYGFLSNSEFQQVLGARIG